MLCLWVGVKSWSPRLGLSDGDPLIPGVFFGFRFFWLGVPGMLVKLAIN